MKKLTTLLALSISVSLLAQLDDVDESPYLYSSHEFSFGVELGYLTSMRPVLQGLPTDQATGYYTQGFTSGFQFRFIGAKSQGFYVNIGFSNTINAESSERIDQLKTDFESYYPEYSVHDISALREEEVRSYDLESTNGLNHINIQVGYQFRRNRASMGVSGGFLYQAPDYQSVELNAKRLNSNREYLVTQSPVGDKISGLGGILCLEAQYRLNRYFELFAKSQASFVHYDFSYYQSFEDLFEGTLQETEFNYSGTVTSLAVFGGIRFCFGG